VRLPILLSDAFSTILRMPISLDIIRTLETCASHAWPALSTTHTGGWTFRFANGYTKRANSVHAIAPTEHFGTIQTAAEVWYAERDRPAIFRLSPLAGDEPDARLAVAGYARIEDVGVYTMSLGPRTEGPPR